MSSCRHNTRKAEQRCPALSKAEDTTSVTTCSGSALESTIIALQPPVSAISGISSSPARAASARSINAATSLDPVNTTARIRASLVSMAPTRPSPGNSCSAAAGTPASRSRRTAAEAIKGVCSAGLASTTLPATNAAPICPVKIASGKFHGLMHATGPSAWPQARPSCAAAVVRACCA